MHPSTALECGHPLTPGCDPRWRGRCGETLLHVAAAHGRADDCYRLVLWGAEPAAVDNRGRYPSDVATVGWIRRFLERGRQRRGYSAWAVL